MIGCAEAVRQLWEFIDGSVDQEQREKIEEHLAFCRRCCGELEFARELQRFLVENAEEELPAPVQARLIATLETLRSSAPDPEADAAP